MAPLTIAGDYTSALTHFALYGLSLMVEQKHPGTVTVGWSQEGQPRAQMHAEGVSEEEIAECVHSYVSSLAADGSWVSVDQAYGRGREAAVFSPFSPRIRGIDAEKYPDDWDSHQKTRQTHLDALMERNDLLSLLWIAGLGEPAYWRFESKAPRPDHGASRWEMKTRNKGQEFVKDRLRLMCADLATWEPSAMLSGITGQTLYDSLDNKPESRTGTGFTVPQPTDTALAFCALVGIANFPVIHQVHRIGVTPGAYPYNALHPRLMVLPVLFGRAASAQGEDSNSTQAGGVTPARLRTVLRSHAYRRVVDELGKAMERGSLSSDIFVSELADEKAILREKGVQAFIAFPIAKVGSDSAPERQILKGSAIPLG